MPSCVSLAPPRPPLRALHRFPEEDGVFNVAGYEPADSEDGGYDMGMTFGDDDVCSSSEVRARSG